MMRIYKVLYDIQKLGNIRRDRASDYLGTSIWLLLQTLRSRLDPHGQGVLA